MAVSIESSGPRGYKTWTVRWKHGEIYDYTDSASSARRIAAKARKEEKSIGWGKPRANPAKGTKLQRKVRAAKSSAKRRVAVALAKYLKQQNPGMNIVAAKVQKLGGGAVKITPIRRRR
jgi:hypothetical protein